MRLLLCCAAVMLQGCATLSALLPTPTGCAPANSPTLPKITADSALAQMEDRNLILVIASERLDLVAYGRQASAIIEACK